MEPSELEYLQKRVDKKYLYRRLQRQVDLAATCYTRKGLTFFHPEKYPILSTLLKYFLIIIGAYNKGRVNTLKYQFEHVQGVISNLPKAFSGFRVLQLSDLHADGLIDRGARLSALLQTIECDLCVVTGDFRFLTSSGYNQAMEQTEQILQSIRASYGLWGVLGNHDFIEFVPHLERAGLGILLNESVVIEKDGAGLCLAGIDDAHLYGCHDLKKALQGRLKSHPCILLSHTPEIYKQAEQAGVDYLLSGHTHGGQICLPGGHAFITNTLCPRNFSHGSWRFHKLRGYTSRGTGSSGLPVRFSCFPEVTLHELCSPREEQ
jgi:hypothetical protein